MTSLDRVVASAPGEEGKITLADFRKTMATARSLATAPKSEEAVAPKPEEVVA